VLAFATGRRRLFLEAHFHTRAFGQLGRGIEVDWAVDDGGFECRDGLALESRGDPAVEVKGQATLQKSIKPIDLSCRSVPETGCLLWRGFDGEFTKSESR
jgi:hypothetical protein